MKYLTSHEAIKPLNKKKGHKIKMNDNPITKKLIELEADGIDFFELSFNPKNPFLEAKREKFIMGFTKDEWMNGNPRYPKSNYFFYKIVDGQKEYIEK